MKRYSLVIIAILLIFSFVLVVNTPENIAFATDAEDYLSAKYNPFSSYQWSSGYSLNSVGIIKEGQNYEYRLEFKTNDSASNIVDYLTKLTGDHTNEDGEDPVAHLEKGTSEGYYTCVVFMGTVGGTYAHVQAGVDDSSGYYVMFTADIKGDTTAHEAAIDEHFNKDLFYFQGIDNPFYSIVPERKGFYIDFQDKTIGSYYDFNLGDKTQALCEYLMNDTFKEAMSRNFNVTVKSSSKDLHIELISENIKLYINSSGEDIWFSQNYEGLDITDIPTPSVSSPEPTPTGNQSIALERIEIIPGHMKTLDVGKKFQIFAELHPGNTADRKIIWTSSNSEFASIDSNGNITAKKGGVVSFTASNEKGNISDTLIVKIIEDEIQKIGIHEVYPYPLGITFKLNPTILPFNAANKRLIYKSDNHRVAAVDANGNVYTNSLGSANITISSESGNVSAKTKIDVYLGGVENQEMYVDPSRITSKLNIYETPGGKVIGSAKSREKVIVIQYYDGIVDGHYWALIKYGDINGWVAVDYLIEELPKNLPVTSVVGGAFRVSSEFGMRNGKEHKGIDLAGCGGKNAVAYMAGKVIITKCETDENGKATGYGNYVVIDHENGLYTLYAHGSKRLVSVGQRVEAGEPVLVIGNTGTGTGAHLHFEIRPYNPKKKTSFYKTKAVNPRDYLNF